MHSNYTNINELLGGASLTLPILRAKYEADYGKLNAITDYAKDTLNMKSVTKTAAAAFGAAITVSGLPAIIAITGALIAAAPVIMAHAPDTVDRIKARL